MQGNFFWSTTEFVLKLCFGERSIDLIKIILLTKNGHTFFEVWIPLTNQIRGRVFHLNLWPKGGKWKKTRFRILEYRPRKWAWWDIYYISEFKGEDHNSNRLLISGSQSDNHPVYLIVNSDSGRVVVTMTNFPHWGNFSSIEWARQRAFIEYIQSIHRKIKEISPRFQIDHKGRGKDVYHL